MSAFSWRVIQGAEGDLQVQQHPEPASSLSDAERFLPQGAYTTLRTYDGLKLLLLDKHFDRLEESSALLGQPVTLQRAALRRLLCELLSAQQWEDSDESRLRLTVNCESAAGEIWISIEALPIPSAQQYEEGVAVLTRTMHRDNPLAKNNAFIAASQEVRTLIGGRVNEVLMVGPHGEVLEGVSSNFFAVRAGELFTADEGVLPGITRTLILDEARAAGLPLRLEAVAAEQLHAIDEAFISSTSRAVLPVVEIDGQPVGDGRPGPITRAIAARYRARLEQEVEALCD